MTNPYIAQDRLGYGQRGWEQISVVLYVCVSSVHALRRLAPTFISNHHDWVIMVTMVTSSTVVEWLHTVWFHTILASTI